MGFLLAGFGLLNLFLGVILFKWVSTMLRPKLLVGCMG
jgi:hypothetical protein